MKITYIAAGFSSSILLVMGSLLPALAKPIPVEVYENGELLARGKYFRDTDTLQVNDKLSGDSRGAYLTWKIRGRTFACNDTTGGGTPPRFCQISGVVPRGEYVELELCALDSPPYHEPNPKPKVCAKAYGQT
jgi:hypothetical protein